MHPSWTSVLPNPGTDCQDSPLTTPEFAPEWHSSSDASSPKQLTKERPHTLGGVGSAEKKGQLDDAEDKQAPQGGMWRGSEHGTHNTASICEHYGIVVLSGYTLHVWSALSNLTASKTRCVVVVPKCLTKDHAHQML